jgi:hypothetical protein
VQCQEEYDERVYYCSTCGHSGLIVPNSRRRPSVLQSGVETVTATDLVRSSWVDIRSRTYPDLRLGRGAVVLLYGPPGGYKSTMLTRLLDGLDGPVALLATEEGPGPALAARFSRLNVKRPDFHVVRGGTVDAVVEQVRAWRCVAFAVDSVTMSTLTAGDLRRAVTACQVQVVLGTIQVTKTSIPAGSNQLIHEADVVISLREGSWTVQKSRYQESTTGLVIQEHRDEQAVSEVGNRREECRQLHPLSVVAHGETPLR